jgi:hypothetical protein
LRDGNRRGIDGGVIAFAQSQQVSVEATPARSSRSVTRDARPLDP